MKKSIFLIGVIIVLIFGFLFFKPSQKENNKTLSLPPSEAIITGKIRPPQGIDMDSLEIVSPFDIQSLNADGEFSIKTYKDGVVSLAAMQRGKQFGLMKIVITSDGKADEDIVIDANSTAQGLIFITPYLLTHDPEKAKEILEIIQKDQKTKEFAGVLEKVAKDESPMSSPEYEKAFTDALNSVLGAINSP